MSWFEDEAYFLFFFGWKPTVRIFTPIHSLSLHQRSVFFLPSVGLSSFLATRWFARAWGSRIGGRKGYFGFKIGDKINRPHLDIRSWRVAEFSGHHKTELPSAYISTYLTKFRTRTAAPAGHMIERHCSMHKAATSPYHPASTATNSARGAQDTPSHIDISSRRGTNTPQ